MDTVFLTRTGASANRLINIAESGPKQNGSERDQKCYPKEVSRRNYEEGVSFCIVKALISHAPVSSQHQNCRTYQSYLVFELLMSVPVPTT